MSGRPQVRTEAKPDKRKLIMDAAMELFKEKGYSNARIIDIAERAGIGKGTVYAYFESKDELMVKIIQEVIRADYDSFIPIEDGDSGIREKLLAYIAMSEKIVDKYGYYATIFMDQVVMDRDVNSTEAVKLVKDMSMDQFLRVRKILQEGRDKGEINPVDLDHAAAFAMTISGTYLLYKISEIEGNQQPEIALTNVLKGLTKEETVDLILNGVGYRETHTGDERDE